MWGHNPSDDLIPIDRLLYPLSCMQIREVGGDDIREGIHVDATQEDEVSGG